MRFAPLSLCLALGLLGCQASTPPQPEFLPLLTSIKQRLDLASPVAVHKWDHRLPVLAPERERQVLEQVSKLALGYDLSPERAAAFFSDQIEANKLIQYTLLGRWTARGQRPAAARIDLANELRPRLDELQATLLFELRRFDQRQPEDCPRKLADALALRTQDPLLHQALARATQHLCVVP